MTATKWGNQWALRRLDIPHNDNRTGPLSAARISLSTDYQKWCHRSKRGHIPLIRSFHGNPPRDLQWVKWWEMPWAQKSMMDILRQNSQSAPQWTGHIPPNTGYRTWCRHSTRDGTCDHRRTRSRWSDTGSFLALSVPECSTNDGHAGASCSDSASASESTNGAVWAVSISWTASVSVLASDEAMDVSSASEWANT